jgi:hypothetical protein
MAGEIDVGPEPTNRGSNISGDYTFIMKDNAANGTGVINTLEIWCNTNMVAKVGFFYNTTGTNYKCRSTVTLGTVTAGSKQTVTTDSLGAAFAKAVVAGDLIGIHIESGTMDYDTSGFGGYWWVAGDKMTVDNESTYASIDGDAFSVKGIGDTSIWSNIKNIRMGTGVVLAADVAQIWAGTTAIAVGDIGG